MTKTPAHLNALRAFEASARHQSFSAAAVELNVSPAAVGQLVRVLEEWLGAPLFLRGGSGRTRLVTTDSARRALPEIRAGFDHLMLGMERLREGSMGGVLTVTVSPAFAAKWLLPRLDKFQNICPETDVRLDTSLKPVDFVAQGIDIGVRYGTGKWPGLAATKLMDEEVYPVCAPAFLRRHSELKDPRGLTTQTLIHDLSMDGDLGFPTWDSWMQQAGLDASPKKPGLRINNSAAVLQSAIEGHGVALARSVMARDDIASARLIRLFPEITVASPLAYYVVYRADCSSLPKLVNFRDWILAEAA